MSIGVVLNLGEEGESVSQGEGEEDLKNPKRELGNPYSVPS